MFKATDRSAGELNGFLDAGSHIQGELVFEAWITKCLTPFDMRNGSAWPKALRRW